MKKKFTKIWAIGMIVVLLSSLLIVGATPASAGTLAWSFLGAAGGFNQVAAGTDVALVKVAPNGDIFAVDAATPTNIYKSTDGGRTWGTLPVTIAGAAIVDLEISPSYETDLTVLVLANTAAGVVVYISENAGVTYAQLGAPVIATANEVGTSLAISPVYNGGGEIMVGTANTAAAVFGDVYIWGTAAAPYVWTSQLLGGGLTEDITAVAFSSSYTLDYTILAIGSTAANTFLHTKVAANAWDATVGTGAAALITTAGVNAITEIDSGVAATEIYSAEIALPSNFQANVYPSSCVAYVAIRSANADDRIYRVLAGGGAVGAAVSIDPNQPTGFAAAGDDEITSIIYSGTTTAGTLIVGYAAEVGGGAGQVAEVYRSDNPGTLATFTGAVKAPTGVSTVAAGQQLTYVAIGSDFATTNIVYAGTLGTNSALSVSLDGGSTFNQYGLIDTVITSVDDIQAASATEVYVVTNNAAPLASLWKTTDGGVTWTRILSVASGGVNTAIIRLSAAYATDGVLLFGNGTGAAGNLQLSTDSGNLWVPLNCAVTPVDAVVKDAYTFYVAGVAGVDISNNGGWTWQIAPTAVSTGVADLEVDLTTGYILAGGFDGLVYLSINGNLSYTAQGAYAATGNAMVAFDAGYGVSNNYIYAGDTGSADPDGLPGTGDETATTGIWRFDTSVVPAPAWVLVDGALTATTGDIVIGPEGTLYASDANAAGAGTDATAGTADDVGGIVRVLDPSALVPVAERVGIADGTAIAGSALTVLTLTEGSNVIFAIGGAATFTYTDTLTTAMPTQVSPEMDEVVASATTAVLSWTVPTGTTSVDYQVSARADFLGAATVNVTTTVGLGAAVVGLTPGTKYYWRIRVSTPVTGPWTDAMTFYTQLTQGAINAPAIISPLAGATGVGLNPTLNWGIIGGATNYYLQLATDVDMTDLLVDASGPTALGNVLVYHVTDITLDYSTTYYWRVKAISGTSETEWSAVVAFTTGAEPVDQEPAVTVTEAPDIIITVEQPAGTTIVVEQVEETVSQGYIWAIIIIGAVLVIAVIVLIVRTRRNV